MSKRRPSKKGTAPKRRRSHLRAASGTGLTSYPGSQFGNPAPEHIHAPYGNDYEALGTEAIFRRIESDINELIGRAYHLSVDRWTIEPCDLAEFEIPMEQARRNLEMWELIREGLRNDDKQVKETAERLLQTRRALDADEAKAAAISLAWLGQSTARRLEHLSDERLDLMRSVARRFSTWPVNLGRGKPKSSGKQVIQRVDFAERYLMGLQLNADYFWPQTENRPVGSATRW